MRNIVWLCSYPKSGNTWVRLFLSHLLFPDNLKSPLDVSNIPTCTSRSFLEQFSDVELSDLTAEEIKNLRPLLHDRISSETTETLFLKSHDAYQQLRDGTPVFSKNATKGIIYILRNPLDIAASYAFHLNDTVDLAIEKMGKMEHSYPEEDKLNPQIEHLLGSWSYNVSSWLNCTDFPVLILKYENLKNDPVHWFSRALKFAGIQRSEQEVKLAMENTEFNRMKLAEDHNGFKEKHVRADRFFRTGKVGQWTDELSSAQISKLTSDHGTVMREVGYLE